MNTNDLRDDLSLRYEPFDNPYASTIERLVKTSLPQFLSSNEDRLEALTEAIVGTKWIRQGPRPTPEGLVAIRSVLREKIAKQAPIAILVGAGAAKTGANSSLSSDVDLAELMGLRTLHCLRERVQRVYPPGVEVRVRLGDLTRSTISPEVQNVEEIAETYVQNFVALSHVLGYDSFLRVVRESEFANSREWRTMTTHYSGLILTYLNEIDEFSVPDGSHERSSAFRELQKDGWYGEIDANTRTYFFDRYRRLYGELSDEEAKVRLSHYFAANLVRKNLDANGARGMHGVVEIANTTPLPNSPKNAPRVYYRTIPDRNHIPWWKARGVVQIGEHDAHVKLVNPWQQIETTPGRLALSRGAKTIVLDTPYLISPTDNVWSYEEQLVRRTERVKV